TLKDYYAELSAAEIRYRQEFAFEAAERLRNRFFMVEVWDRMGVDYRAVLKTIVANPPPQQTEFQHMLFSKIVPNCKKLGLLDAGATGGKPGWLRQKFTELGIIQFEDWADTSDEYEAFALGQGDEPVSQAS